VTTIAVQAQTIPETETTQNKSVNRGVVSDTKKCPFSDQLYHTFHHDLTIKIPHASTQYSPPPAKTPKYWRQHHRKKTETSFHLLQE
jgi:hypothetical protein